VLRRVSSIGRTPAGGLRTACRVLLLGLCLQATGCGEAFVVGDARPTSARGANLIVVSIDTLRADRLGSYGYDRPTSPALDAMAARGVRFASAVADSSWTVPSHITLFTGLAPTAHGVTSDQMRLDEGIPTLAEVLGQAGYRSYAYTAGRYMDRRYGFDQGFEVYDDAEKDLETTLDLGRRVIESSAPGEPYFLFLHTYDVHCPYDPPERYSAMFRTRPAQDWIETEGRCGNPDYNRMKLTRGQVRFLSDQYDAGIRAADDALGEFFAFLDARDELANTVLVLLSDHGEEFAEHGQIGHGETLFIEVLQVPLIVVAPGLAPRAVSQHVVLADVMPTLLGLLELPAPAMNGASLIPLMRGDREWARTDVFSELDRKVQLRSLLRGRDHLVMNVTRDSAWWFNHAVDPAEQRPLPLQGGTLGGELREQLLAHDASIPRPERVLTADIPEEARERLRALGYVE